MFLAITTAFYWLFGEQPLAPVQNLIFKYQAADDASSGGMKRHYLEFFDSSINFISSYKFKNMFQ